MDKEELEFKVNQVVYTKLFDDDECEKILKLYHNMNQAISYTSVIPKFGIKFSNSEEKLSVDDLRRSKAKSLSYDECDWILKKLGDKVQDLNQKYFKFGDMEINNIDILEYGLTDKFDWHGDMGPNRPFSLRKISVVAFISDRNEYEGGQLEFMPKLREPLKMEKGYIVAFPSHKIHRVTPVISGTRRVLVTWLMGE
jgi:hypothetical protein